MDFQTVDELNEHFRQKSIELIVAREQMIYEAAVWYASKMKRLQDDEAAALAKLQPESHCKSDEGRMSYVQRI